jgi:hypothetical protein
MVKDCSIFTCWRKNPQDRQSDDPEGMLIEFSNHDPRFYLRTAILSGYLNDFEWLAVGGMHLHLFKSHTCVQIKGMIGILCIYP